MNAFDAVMDALTRPDEWREEMCVLRHRSGVAIWMANVPILDTNLYPVPLRLSLRQKYRMRRAALEVREQRVARQVAGLLRGDQ